MQAAHLHKAGLDNELACSYRPIVAYSPYQEATWVLGRVQRMIKSPYQLCLLGSTFGKQGASIFLFLN